MELMLLTRWANIALATNFDSSELLGADTMGTLYLGGSMNGGTPIAGWFIKGNPI